MIGPRDIVKIALNLVVIYIIGGVMLAAMYAFTSPVIYKNAVKGRMVALEKIMPEADQIEKLGDWTIHDRTAEYFIAKKDSSKCGYIVESYGKGYSSYIHVLIAADTAFKVKRISILSHAETPGLGDEIEASWFKKQFTEKSAAQMRVIKASTEENIQAISGATISSRAVTEDAVKCALEYLVHAEKGKGRNDNPQDQ